MKSINVERGFFLWKVVFFKIGKHDFTFIREHSMATANLNKSEDFVTNTTIHQITYLLGPESA